MPLATCLISGTVYTVGGIAAPGITVYCHRVIKSGTLIESAPRLVATSSVGGAVSFSLPRASTAYLSANAEGLNADEHNGTAFPIPDAATATLESLLPLTSALGAQITLEYIQDAIASMLEEGPGIVIDYNDTTGKIVISSWDWVAAEPSGWIAAI